MSVVTVSPLNSPRSQDERSQPGMKRIAPKERRPRTSQLIGVLQLTSGVHFACAAHERTRFRGVMMLRRANAAVVFSLFCLFTTPAAAEPVRITAGRVFLPGIVQGGTMDISGTQGFSLTALTANASKAFETCSVPECVAGTPLDLFVQFGGDTLANAHATLNGVTYPDVDSANSPAFTNSFFHGSATAPPLGNAPTTIMAPFTFDGGFFLAGTGLLRELTGGRDRYSVPASVWRDRLAPELVHREYQLRLRRLGAGPGARDTPADRDGARGRLLRAAAAHTSDRHVIAGPRSGSHPAASDRALPVVPEASS